MKDKILQYYKKMSIGYIKKFKSIYSSKLFPKMTTGPIYGGAICYSEAFSFCSMCDVFKINTIIESGINNGGSTKILALYFSKSDIKITSIDFRVKDELKTLLSPRITFVNGDGIEIISKILKVAKKNPTLRIAIMLDGPKGNDAINLAQYCLKYRNVEFVGIHDLYKKDNPAREKFDNLPNRFFTTDEDWFIKRFSQLDSNKDFQTYNSEFGSYNFTFGYLINPKYLK